VSQDREEKWRFHEYQPHQAQPMHKRLIGKRPLQGLMRLRAVLKEQWSKRWAIKRCGKRLRATQSLQSTLAETAETAAGITGAQLPGAIAEALPAVIPSTLGGLKAVGAWADAHPVHAVVLLQTLKEFVPGFRKMTGLRPLLVNHTIGCDQSARRVSTTLRHMILEFTEV
jgi:hypothetical protein